MEDWVEPERRLKLREGNNETKKSTGDPPACTLTGGEVGQVLAAPRDGVLQHGGQQVHAGVKQAKLGKGEQGKGERHEELPRQHVELLLRGHARQEGQDELDALHLMVLQGEVEHQDEPHDGQRLVRRRQLRVPGQ